MKSKKEKGEKEERKEIIKDILDKKRNVIDLIVEMKNLTSLAIDLGFSALLLQDKKLAEKVKELEEELNIKQYEIETLCMVAATNVSEALGLTSVIRVASSVEAISNAVGELTDSILRGIKPHPIISEALKAAAYTVDYINVSKKSKIVGKTIKEITKGEVTVVGLKREDSWSYQPKPEDRIEAGDIMVISGRQSKLNELLKEIKK